MADEYCISPCIICPECGCQDLEKVIAEEFSDYYTQDVWCWDCGASWCELDFYGDDDT